MNFSPVTPNLPSMKSPVVGVTFADSATTPQPQVADWVAGANLQVAHAVVTGSFEAFASSLKPMASSWMVGSIGPNPDMIVALRRLGASIHRRLGAAMVVVFSARCR